MPWTAGCGWAFGGVENKAVRLCVFNRLAGFNPVTTGVAGHAQGVVAHAQQPNPVGILGVRSFDHKLLILVLKPGGTVRVSKYLIFEFVDGVVHGYFSQVC